MIEGENYIYIYIYVFNAVSYTHLDVYKRQLYNYPTGRNEMS